MKPTVTVVEVRGRPGQSVETAIERSISVAKDLDSMVILEVNTIMLIVYPSSTVRNLLAEYRRQVATVVTKD